MTFQEAEEKIIRDGEYFVRDGKKFKRVIVPLNQPYLEEYNKLLAEKIMTKDDVKNYAKDNQFTIWFFEVYYLKGESFKS